MIADQLKNINRYRVLGPLFAKAIEYLETADFAALPAGKYEVDGTDVFAIINEYTTKAAADCEPETHLKYIDIQYMVSGTERFGFALLQDQTPLKPYDENADLLVYKPEGFNYIDLKPGMFVIFYPTDIHQPEMFAAAPMPVKKVVMKIRTIDN